MDIFSFFFDLPRAIKCFELWVAQFACYLLLVRLNSSFPPMSTLRKGLLEGHVGCGRHAGVSGISFTVFFTHCQNAELKLHACGLIEKTSERCEIRAAVMRE